MDKKRLHALSEILESERAYIADMVKWCRDFKMQIISYALDVEDRYEFCRVVFSEMEEILSIHIEIFDEMMERNGDGGGDLCTDTDDAHAELEYHTIFSKYIGRFDAYLRYASSLPMIEHTFRRRMAVNQELRSLCGKFLHAHKMDVLGYQHFMYRPVQKVVRYGVLFEALFKRESMQAHRDGITRLLERLSKIQTGVDDVYEESKRMFRVYEILKSLRRAPTLVEPVGIDMMRRSRRVLKEGDVVVGMGGDDEPKLTRVIILDQFALFCDIIVQDGVDGLYLKKMVTPCEYSIVGDVNIERIKTGAAKFNTIALASKLGGAPIKMYVSMRENVDEWVNSFLDMSARVIQQYDTMIHVGRVGEIPDDNVSSVSVPRIFFDGSPSYRIECRADSEPESPAKRYGTINVPETSQSAIARSSHENISFSYRDYVNDHIRSFRDNAGYSCCGPLTRSIFGRTIRIRRIESSIYDEPLYLYCTGSGMYQYMKGRKRKVYSGHVKKLVYDHNNSVLAFVSGSTLRVSSFNVQSDTLDPKTLCEGVNDFFYGMFAKEPIIAVKRNTVENSCILLLFKLKQSGATMRSGLFRKIYIKSAVHSVRFFRRDLIISARSFYVINMGTLMIKELLNPMDPYLPYYFVISHNVVALKVINTDNGCYIVCYNTIGFIIDSNGQTLNPHTVYVWHGSPTDFKVIGGYLIALGESSISVYSVESGNLLYFDTAQNLKFISGNNSNLLHSDGTIYELKLPLLTTDSSSLLPISGDVA